MVRSASLAVKITEKSEKLFQNGPFTLRDCDLSCNGGVNVAVRSIANAISPAKRLVRAELTFRVICV